MAGRQCTVCVHPELAEITKAIGAGVPLREIASRYGFKSQSIVGRHRIKCMGLPVRRQGSVDASKSAALASRSKPRRTSRLTSDADPGRCEKCGTSSTDISPESILKRAERLLQRAETIAEKADDAENYRLTLLACDRANKSLELLAKAVGLISDGTNVNIAFGIRANADPLAQVSNAELVQMIARLKREMALESGDNVIEGELIATSSPLRAGERRRALIRPAVIEAGAFDAGSFGAGESFER